MKRLLSHVKTKVELIQFLARKTLEKGSHNGKVVVVALGSHCKATHKDGAYLEKSQEPGGGGVLPYKRLMGMCRWMGSHFHDWIDYNGVTFLVELLEWGRTFSGFLG